MRPELFEHVISFDEALRRIMAAAAPIERVERVSLADSCGRVAAERVVAAFDVPPFDRAAMDGYAVRAIDVEGASTTSPVPLALLTRTFAGESPAAPLVPGTAVEVATGAPLPPGADAVVMVERTRRDADRVLVEEAVRPGQSVGRRAADIPAGFGVVSPGDYITPARAGALAAIGCTDLAVYAKPDVVVFATGNEVVSVGRPLGQDQIYDVNSTTIAAVVRAHGGRDILREPVGDSAAALAAALRTGGGDVIVCSGGSSVGSRDLVTDAVSACGDILLHGIAIKPGKPTLVGRVGTAVLFGMPGNPTSCLSNSYLLLAPFLRAVARLPPWRPSRVVAPLARTVRSTPGRHHFFSVRLEEGRVVPAFKSSGDITSLAQADGYIEIPPGVPALEAGESVTVTLF